MSLQQRFHQKTEEFLVGERVHPCNFYNDSKSKKKKKKAVHVSCVCALFFGEDVTLSLTKVFGNVWHFLHKNLESATGI